MNESDRSITDLIERGLWVFFGEKAESNKKFPLVQIATIKARAWQALKGRR